MDLSQLAAQLFTVRDYTKTSKQISSSLKKIRDIGYKSVQVSGLGPIEDSELAKVIKGEGLVCCATHEPSISIIENPHQVVQRLNKLNCKYTAYPHPINVDLSSIKGVIDFATKLDKAGEILAKNNKVLAYHNHSMEFVRLEGRLIMDLIYENTHPQNLQSELDTYWVQYGGGDVVKWCEKLKNRIPLIHLKDYAIKAPSEPVFAEIGYGNLDWKSIIAEAEKSGCEWFIVEQDICPGDPFESLKKSFNYIVESFCSALEGKSR